MFVIGIGERKTPKAVITACDKFIYIEILKKENEEVTVDKSRKKPGATARSRSTIRVSKKLENLIQDSIDEISDDNGWVFLRKLGSHIIKKKPDFDPRNYGFPKLYPLIKKINSVETKEIESGEENIKHIYVKNK